jgi:hypothetical protein
MQDKSVLRGAAAALVAGIALTAAGCAADATPVTTQVAAQAKGTSVPLPPPSSAAATTSTASATSGTSVANQSTTGARTSTAPNSASTSGLSSTPQAKVVGGAVISTAQLPAGSSEQWTPVGSALTRDVTGHVVAINECASVQGASSWTQQGYVGVNGQDPALEGVFTFGSAAQAASAYTAAVQEMAACRQTSRALQSTNKIATDAVVLTTATDTRTENHAMAWERSWTGVEGMSAAGPQINHYYFALRGSTLVALQFSELNPTAGHRYAVTGDTQILAKLLS